MPSDIWQLICHSIVTSVISCDVVCDCNIRDIILNYLGSSDLDKKSEYNFSSYGFPKQLIITNNTAKFYLVCLTYHNMYTFCPFL